MGHVRGFERDVIRASVDGFHNPRSIRYRQGRSSPQGFYFDSYDYAGLKRFLLDPLSEGGSEQYRSAIFDSSLDQPVQTEEKSSLRDAILLFDGIFLHRPELFDYWNFSVFLDVDFSISIPRGAQRGEGFGSPDPTAKSNSRYIEGQKLYFNECHPKSLATLVIDNNDLSAPRVTGGTLSQALWDAVNYGVDLSLIELNLKSSYQERLEHHESALALVSELKRAGERLFKT
jgi:uridine kinase